MTKGQRIKLLREEKLYGLTELAAKIDVSKQTLYKYERDIVTNIPSDKIEALAKVLNTTPEYIMGWKEVEVQAVTDADRIKAERLYELYTKSSPEVQQAVELMLKSSQPKS